jgi:hypothetical protein
MRSLTILALFVTALLATAIGPARPVYAAPVVTNVNDAGVGSLRQAILDVQNGETITFALDAPATINLTQSITIATKAFTIQGLGPDMLSISGNNTVNIFTIVASANVTITNMTLRDGNNNANTTGGALNMVAATRATLDNVIIRGHQAQYGGAFYNEGTLTLNRTTVVSNTASVEGGGIFNAGILVITSSTIEGNQASKYGGGVMNNDVATLTVTNSLIARNEAGGGGGLFNSGTLTVTRSLIHENLQTEPLQYGGGGIGTSGGSVSVINTTLSENRANHVGGGIDNYFSRLTLANTTIANNISTNVNGAGGLSSENNSSITIRNTILAGNTNASGGPRDCQGNPIISQGHNLIGVGDDCGFPAISTDRVGSTGAPIDPLLAALADNGGPTQTHLPLTGSPALDGGNPATPGSGGASCETTDQRGFNRPQGSACDIGAVEVGEAPVATKLAFSVQPGGATAGSLLNPQPTVQVLDDNGTLVPTYSGTITLTLTEGSPGAILNGTTSVQVLNGVASFTNLSIDRAGNGFILLASASGLVSSQSLSFNISAVPTATNWLVLLYLAGDNEGGLSEQMVLMLNRLQHNPAARIVALYDGPGATDSRIYTWNEAGRQDVTEQAATAASWVGGIPGSVGARELDTGSSATIQNFVNWARVAYPGATHTFLSLVDHGGGWAPDFGNGPQPPGARVVQAGGWRGMSQDYHSPTGAGMNSLSTYDTGVALSGLDLDLLFYDACLMGMLESAYEVAPSVDYLIAGQNLLFAEFPYDVYFSSTGLNSSTTPGQLASHIVDSYNPLFTELNPFTLAALDLRSLRNADNLAGRVNTLAGRLIDLLPPSPVPLDNPIRQRIAAAYNAAQKFDYDNSLSIDPEDGYVDLIGFANGLNADTSLPTNVRSAALAVVETAEEMVIARRTESGIFAGRPWNLSGAQGLSIFLPLAEQDWRPTQVLTDEVVPQDQLALYADPTQLAFRTAAPKWAELLLRLQANTPIRAPAPAQQPALVQDNPRLRQIYSSPAPVPLQRGILITLPMIRR